MQRTSCRLLGMVSGPALMLLLRPCHFREKPPVTRDSLGRKTYEKTWLLGEGMEMYQETMVRVLLPQSLYLCASARRGLDF